MHEIKYAHCTFGVPFGLFSVPVIAQIGVSVYTLYVEK